MQSVYEDFEIDFSKMIDYDYGEEDEEAEEK